MDTVESYTYPVRAYHTNKEGNLFVHQILNFLQDAAHNHADSRGFGQQQLVHDNLFWVLSRLSLEIDVLPRQGDKLELSTWVKSIHGTFSEREFSISDKNKSVIRASSLWFCLSGEAHKPARLSDKYSALMLAKEIYATAKGTQKLMFNEPEFAEGTEFKVLDSDIDMVNHVNNATYARWIFDDIHSKNDHQPRLANLKINYLDECFLGDQVVVKSASLHPGSKAHQVVSRLSGKLLCLASTIWK